MLPSNCEFHEIQWSASQTSLRGINECLSALSRFIAYWIKFGIQDLQVIQRTCKKGHTFLKGVYETTSMHVL
jgi:hypothetical protein